MGCASSLLVERSHNGKNTTEMNGSKDHRSKTQTSDTLDRTPSHMLSTGMNPKSSLSVESWSNADSRVVGERRESEEFTSFPNSNELTRRSSAAIMIQRRARGMGARNGVSKRRQSVFAENQFLNSLNPRLSPAENAANALLELALVIAFL